STTVDVESGKYGGGKIAAHYVLPGYNEPYPQTIDLHYNGVALEKLFSDWGIKDTGLRGDAPRQLALHLDKDKVLEGGGKGNATLAKSTVAFSNAKYPLALSGSSDFTIDNGVIKFANADLNTDHSHINFTGSLRIADVSTDMAIKIHSDDFSE